jgi:ribosome biogenesis protein MAK21
MPAKALGPKGAAPQTKAVDDTPELRAEVRAFASQLGLSAGGGGAAFDFDDFAPTKAAAVGRAAAAAAAPRAADGSSGKRDKGGKSSKGKDTSWDAKQPAGGKGSDAGRHAAPADGAAAAAAAKQAAHDAAVEGRSWVDSVGPRPGESKGRSLMGADEPTIWYEAAAGLPPLAPPPGRASGALGEAAAEKLRSAGEALVEREAGAFEKDLARRNAADSRWLAQVRRSGTTADKVAAMTLLVQVRR